VYLTAHIPGTAFLWGVAQEQNSSTRSSSTADASFGKTHTFTRTCVKQRRDITGSAIEAHRVPAMPCAVPQFRRREGELLEAIATFALASRSVRTWNSRSAARLPSSL
jgi:hypothetical protein